MQYCCAFCKVTQNHCTRRLLRCGNCFALHYCSRECQLKHWRLCHRSICNNAKPIETYRRWIIQSGYIIDEQTEALVRMSINVWTKHKIKLVGVMRVDFDGNVIDPLKLFVDEFNSLVLFVRWFQSNSASFNMNMLDQLRKHWVELEPTKNQCLVLVVSPENRWVRFWHRDVLHLK